MAVDTNRMLGNVVSDYSTGLEGTRAEDQVLTQGDRQIWGEQGAFLGRVARKLGQGLKAGLLAHGMAITQNNM